MRTAPWLRADAGLSGLACGIAFIAGRHWSGDGRADPVLVMLAAICQATGGFFDFNHKLHGPAAMIGSPLLTAACVTFQIALAWVPWPACRACIPGLHTGPGAAAAAGGASAVDQFCADDRSLLSGLRRAKGRRHRSHSANQPAGGVARGVTGYRGWANRLIFATSYPWVGWMPLALLMTGGGQSGPGG